jgi:hypothetical protein
MNHTYPIQSFDKNYLDNLIGSFFNNNSQKFLSILNNYDNIFISGSTILQILSKKIYESLDNTNNMASDIDIYIYLDDNHLDDNQCKLYDYNKLVNNLINSDLSKYLEDENYDYIDMTNNHNLYYEFSEYNAAYIKYENIELNKKIDVIFITESIEKYINSSFDLSIVMNYYYKGNIYSKYYQDILDNKAKISISTINNSKILINKLDTFIERYNKYKSRGYNIIVGKNNILTPNNLIYLSQMQNVYTFSDKLIYQEYYYNEFYIKNIIISFINEIYLTNIIILKKTGLILQYDKSQYIKLPYLYQKELCLNCHKINIYCECGIKHRYRASTINSTNKENKVMFEYILKNKVFIKNDNRYEQLKLSDECKNENKKLFEYYLLNKDKFYLKIEINIDLKKMLIKYRKHIQYDKQIIKSYLENKFKKFMHVALISTLLYNKN